MENKIPKELKGVKGVKEIKTIQELFKRVYNRAKEKIFATLKEIKPQRKRYLISRALVFSRENKDVLVIIADPKTDDVVATYNNHYSVAKIGVSSYLHLKKNVIKGILERETTNDRETEKKVGEFLAFMDAFLFKTSLQICQEKQKKTQEKPPNLDLQPQSQK